MSGWFFSRIALARASCCGAGVAVDEQDRAGLDPALLELGAERRDLRLVERLLDLAVGEHALVHLEPQRALDQRHVLLEEQIVGVRPVDAPDLVDVAEAFGDQQRGLRAGALQDGVDRHRRAVQEQPGRAIVAAGLLDPAVDAVDQPLRRRQRLAEAQRAGLVVEHRDVGEGAADIGGEAHLGCALEPGFAFGTPVDPYLSAWIIGSLQRASRLQTRRPARSRTPAVNLTHRNCLAAVASLASDQRC